MKISDSIELKIQRLLSEYQNTKITYRQEKQKLQEAQERLQNVEAARNIIQIVAQQVQQKTHDRISVVVTSCLQSIFGKEYSFKIRFDRKRGRTEAHLILMKSGHEIEDPLNEDSGGVMDVATFALRLSCMMLIKPKLRRLLILDEPFKFVSVKYREAIRDMLMKLSEDFKLQIIMVTHIPELVCGKRVQL